VFHFLNNLKIIFLSTETLQTALGLIETMYQRLHRSSNKYCYNKRNRCCDFRTEILNITQIQKYLILNDTLKKIRRHDGLSHGLHSEKDLDYDWWVFIAVVARFRYQFYLCTYLGLRFGICRAKSD
jgi:hypothetical protein